MNTTFLSSLVVTLLVAVANGFVLNPTARSSSSSALNAAKFSTPGMWPNGLSFGAGTFKFYQNFNSWMGVFPEEDRKAYPEIFSMPKGVYEVSLPKPLGIIFEEIEIGKGVFVQDLVEGGAAERQGKIQRGDVLIGITAIKVVGARWERRLLPTRPWSFDTVVGAIGSNEPKWSCDNVVMMFERPDEADQETVDEFMQFFNPPGDSPWRQQQ